MKLQVFQHVPFEGPGMIKDWAIRNHHDLETTKLYEDYVLPGLNEVDALIIMGGPMSVNDNKKYPWLTKEIGFIKKAINKHKAVIGICLGAQLIAKAMGVKVYPGHIKEIGWYPVEFDTENLHKSGLDFIPEKVTVFHWHGDTFDIPGGALHLARSATFPNQAFVYKNRVIALQFHMEVTKHSMMEMVINGKEELTEKGCIQQEKEILAKMGNINFCNELMLKILDRIAT